MGDAESYRVRVVEVIPGQAWHRPKVAWGADESNRIITFEPTADEVIAFASSLTADTGPMYVELAGDRVLAIDEVTSNGKRIVPRGIEY